MVATRSETKDELPHSAIELTFVEEGVGRVTCGKSTRVTYRQSRESDVLILRFVCFLVNRGDCVCVEVDFLIFDDWQGLEPYYAGWIYSRRRSSCLNSVLTFVTRVTELQGTVRSITKAA